MNTSSAGTKCRFSDFRRRDFDEWLHASARLNCFLSEIGSTVRSPESSIEMNMLSEGFRIADLLNTF